MALTSKAHAVEMKRSKSTQPLSKKCNETLTRQRSFVGDKNKQTGKYNEVKLEKVLAEAEESFGKAEYEDAFVKFSRGAALKPNNEAFALGIRKSRIAILNDLKNSGDSLQTFKQAAGNVSDSAQDYVQSDLKLSSRCKTVNTNDTNNILFSTQRRRSSDELYKVKIHNGNEYKIVSATRQDLKEYMKDKDYFKMKEQNAKEWKKLRGKMNKKLAEKEAFERYEKEAKLLEEKSNIRQHCEEQVNLIGRYYQNGKIPDVIRFSENFVKYLNKKPDKLLQRKWVYLATAFNYLARAYIEQENFEKAKVYGEKLYKIAISSANTELISQSYILSGKIYVKFGKFEEAAFVWEKLIPLTENHEKKAWLFHEIGRCYFELKKYDFSSKYGADSGYWGEKCSSSKWVCSANILQGQSEMKKNNYKEALQHFLRAKKHAELCNDEGILKYLESVEEVLAMAAEKPKLNSTSNNDNC